MSDDQKKATSIEELLQKREELERTLQDEFNREVTVLFTDICGYTKFMETHGDIAGRAMLQNHNKIIFPLIKEHNGRIIKTIGDAVMAAFEEPENAVACATAIQEKLALHNKTASPSGKIEVKIGINCGDALVDGDDLFGDAVNVAARIQSAAGPGEILISRSIYERICSCDDMLCRFHESKEVKGKAEALDLYRVVWRPEDMAARIDSGVRGAGMTRHKAHEPLKVLQLELNREENRLKISAHEQIGGQTNTVRHYEELTPDFTAIERQCRELVDILNKNNRMGKVSIETLQKLRETGKGLANELFTPKIRETINNTSADHLQITIDDQLVQVPWELLFSGTQFLCQRFSMGRLVKTRQQVSSEARGRGLAKPLRMLVLADPRGDLKGADQEGRELKDAMGMYDDLVNVAVRSEDVTPDFIRQKIRNFDLVHYAGHADYDREHPEKSGWLLTDGTITASDIMQMAGTQTLPALIFSNACQSARTEEWNINEGFQDEIFGMANAFLLSGVKHYIGTFWEILDAPSRSYGVEFYRSLLSGECVGEAMRQARMAVIKEYGEETIVWASYMLYGDPTFNYLDHLIVAAPEDDESDAADKTSAVKRGRAGEPVDIDAARVAAKKKVTWLLLAASVLLIVGGAWWMNREKPAENFFSYEQAVLTAFQAGKYDEMAKASQVLLEKDPTSVLPALLQGDMALQQGDLEGAVKLYQQVVNTDAAPAKFLAQAFMGLGRLASLQDETDRSLDYYSKASQLQPDDVSSWQAQAMVLQKSGRDKEAMGLLDRATGLAPDNRALAALARQARAKVELAADQQKQERIDKLVQELLEVKEPAAGAMPDSDNWTSRPLTAWIMDMEVQGYTLQEGKESMVGIGLADRLLDNGRIKLVERAVLDKLLAELKLGTSNLVDQRTALALGRLLAARMILTGKMIHAGPETQVSLRLIETETGNILAMLSETFPSAAPADLMVEKLAPLLLEKTEKSFPLRGKIIAVEGEDITLNIGSAVGVIDNLKFDVNNNVATLEVIACQADTSLARVVEGEHQLIPGLKVKEI